MTPESDDHLYAAFGLRIASEFVLPELPALERRVEPDVRIRRGAVEPVDTERVSGEKGRYVDGEPGRCRITYEEFGSVSVESGRRVVVDLEPTVSGTSKVFRRLLQGQVLAVLLHQRGLLVLHASAVAVDGGAVCFVGPSGAGKTTTAAACYADGNALLDDDVVAVDLEGSQPTVRPGVPELKLYTETADALGLDVHEADGDDAGSPKQYHVPSVRGERPAVPLAGCYTLSVGDEPAVEPVAPQEQVMTLVSNTYTVGLLDETDAATDNVAQCAEVADSVPVRRLVRPDSLERVDEVVDVVTRDAGSRQPAGSVGRRTNAEVDP